MTNARAGNNYTTSLTGFPRGYNSSGNIVALDVLNAAFDLLPPDESTSSAPLTSTLPAGSTHASQSRMSASHPVGPIVGGVVGGIAALSLLAGMASWYRRNRRHAETLIISADKQSEGDGVIAPFVSYPHALLTDGTSESSSGYAPYVSPPVHSKFQRMNAPPQPPQSRSESTGASDIPTGSGDSIAPSPSDILSLVRGVVQHVLRDREVAPPEYER